MVGIKMGGILYIFENLVKAYMFESKEYKNVSYESKNIALQSWQCFSCT